MDAREFNNLFIYLLKYLFIFKRKKVPVKIITINVQHFGKGVVLEASALLTYAVDNS